MKAAIVEKVGELKVINIPDPIVGEYDVLCEMLYGATCTGTDQHIIYGRTSFAQVPYPTILGHESVGRVKEVGREVKYFKIGDLVSRVGAPPSKDGQLDSHWGGFAQLGIARDHWAMSKDNIPIEQWNQHRVNQIIPYGIDPAEATMIITWRETLSYLKRMGMEEGKSILILGSGGNGLSFANHAINLNSSKVVMTGNEERKVLSKTIGVSDYYNYKDEDLVGRIMEDHPMGFDFIIDAVGKSGDINKMIPMIKNKGTIGIYGIDDYNNLMLNPLASGKSFKFYNGGYDEEETHEEVVSSIKRGKLLARNWIDLENSFDLDQIDKAFHAINQNNMVKALIKLS